MIPYLVSYVLRFVLVLTPELDMYNNFSSGILYIAHGSTLFIYLAFNKLFRRVLIGYLCFKFIKKWFITLNKIVYLK